METTITIPRPLNTYGQSRWLKYKAVYSQVMEELKFYGKSGDPIPETSNLYRQLVAKFYKKYPKLSPTNNDQRTTIND